jgi:bacillithiol biosynthesis cysteine-adding enzyme BshC
MTDLDLTELGLLPPLPRAFLEGEALELLEPLRFLEPGLDPTGEAPAADRRALADALARTNASLGHPRARELAERLADPDTLVVVTGQQPGMFGGPLYTLSKAIAAARWAARLSDQGRPAVAVFWASTEDHDFAEVARAAVPGGDGLLRWNLGEDPSPLMPVGHRPFGPSIETALEAWRGEYGRGDYGDWIDRLTEVHRPDSTFGDAFCRTLIAALGQRCPLLLDAMDPALKQAQAPAMLRLVEERHALEEAQARADERIEGSGFSLQVRPQPGTSPLFLVHEGARRRIEWRDADRFSLRGLDGFEESVDWLCQVVEDDPRAVSPGVLARPAFQDFALGTHLQVLGPGEVAYLPQAVPTYRLLGVAPPWVSLRPQALVLTARQLRQAEEVELSLGDLIGGELDVGATVAERAGEGFVAPVRAEIERQLASLEGPALALDASLESPLRKTGEQVRRALEIFDGKVGAAAARRHQVIARRIEKLVNAVRPDDALQERVVTGAHFVGRYRGFVDAMWEQLGLDPRRLHLIDPGRNAE